MKLTRQRLRQLIIETLQETKRYIGSPEGGVTPADTAYQNAIWKDEYAADVHPKIADLMKTGVEGRKQGRQLASALASPHSQYAREGELTPEEETALDHLDFDRAMEQSMPRADTEYLIDKGALWGAMKGKSERILDHFGFSYPEKHIGPDFDYSDLGPQFRFQAAALGCEVKDLAFIDIFEDPSAEKTLYAIYDIIREAEATSEEIPGDQGDFGENYLYNVGGLKILLTNHMGGHVTATICGR